MKKKVSKFLIILLVILISIFTGYEYPDLVEVPKKYVHFLMNKLGLRDNFLNKKINKEVLKNFDQDDFLEFKGNSFSVFLSLSQIYSVLLFLYLADLFSRKNFLPYLYLPFEPQL